MLHEAIYMYAFFKDYRLLHVCSFLSLETATCMYMQSYRQVTEYGDLLKNRK